MSNMLRANGELYDLKADPYQLSSLHKVAEADAHQDAVQSVVKTEKLRRKYVPRLAP